MGIGELLSDHVLSAMTLNLTVGEFRASIGVQDRWVVSYSLSFNINKTSERQEDIFLGDQGNCRYVSGVTVHNG